MDYKSAIIKGIQTIQETAGSEEIKREWESILDIVRSEDSENKLAVMYLSFKEEIAKASGHKTEPFKVQTKDGEVKVFTSVDELLKFAGA